MLVRIDLVGIVSRTSCKVALIRIDLVHAHTDSIASELYETCMEVEWNINFTDIHSHS